MRGQIIAEGSVSWTENENATKDFNIPLPATAPADSEHLLVAVKNASAVVGLAVQISNMIAFDSTAEACELVAGSDFSIAAATAKSAVVTGMLPGVASRLTFTKSAATAAAFSAYVEVRRL